MQGDKDMGIREGIGTCCEGEEYMAGRDPNNQSVGEGGGDGRLQDDKYVGIREAVCRHL